MPKTESVKESHQKLQVYRKAACTILVAHKAIFFCQMGFLKFLKENLMYLTKWSHNLEILFFVLVLRETQTAAARQAKVFEQEIQHGPLCGLHSMLLGLQFLITFFYWMIIFDRNAERTGLELYKVVYYHSVPLVLVSIEFFLNRMLVKFDHFKYPVIFMVVYGFFNLFFTLYDREPVYPYLDYKDYVSVLFLLGAVAMCMVGILLFWSVQWVKAKKQ